MAQEASQWRLSVEQEVVDANMREFGHDAVEGRHDEVDDLLVLHGALVDLSL